MRNLVYGQGGELVYGGGSSAARPEPPELVYLDFVLLQIRVLRSCTLNELYSRLQDCFDRLDMLGHEAPMIAIDPYTYRLQGGWTIAPETELLIERRERMVEDQLLPE